MDHDSNSAVCAMAMAMKIFCGEIVFGGSDGGWWRYNTISYSKTVDAVHRDGMITTAGQMNSPSEYKDAHCCSFLSIFVYHYGSLAIYTLHLQSSSPTHTLSFCPVLQFPSSNFSTQSFFIRIKYILYHRTDNIFHTSIERSREEWQRRKENLDVRIFSLF